MNHANGMNFISRVCIAGLFISFFFSRFATATPFKVETIVAGLEHPWALAFLPDGRLLVTERGGHLRIIKQGKLLPNPVEGLPLIEPIGQGGLLDIVLHPDYQNNGWLYFSYAEPDKGVFFSEYGTAVARARLDGSRLKDLQVIFSMNKKSGGGRHFGSRLVFDRDNYLYITVGDRGERMRAQDLNDHAGSVIRLHDDGRIPTDNPFVNTANARPEIYSYGHRNPQGLALHPATGEVWLHEHGPQGGDEINRILPGRNYGWPVITFGENYVTGTRIGEGTHKQGMEQPIHQWTPSIAPSGMAFYSGRGFDEWQGSLFVGALKFQLLARIELRNNHVINEERLLERQLGRIRDVRNGPDGFLYLLTDADDGAVVRLVPGRQ